MHYPHSDLWEGANFQIRALGPLKSIQLTDHYAPSLSNGLPEATAITLQKFEEAR